VKNMKETIMDAKVEADGSRLAEDVKAIVRDALPDGWKDAATATDRSVRSHPWQAIGVGAAVGLLLGLLIARR
jgi:ElaB/YqjD/DUF883 family membrane-anchored ribosome-binding protein